MPLSRAATLLLALLLASLAGCASTDARAPRSRRAPLPVDGAQIAGVSAHDYLERRAALLVAGATVTASPMGISVHAPAGGAAAAIARDGYLLTAARCVDGKGVRVYLYGDDAWYAPARVVWTGDRARSPLLDIAIVKVDVPLPGALEWAAPQDVTEGADLLAFGYRRATGAEGETGGVGLTIISGRAIPGGSVAMAEATLPGEPPVATMLHDIASLEEEGGAAVATRAGRLVGIHIGSIDAPDGGRAGVTVQPDPAWVARRIDQDRRAHGH